MSMVRKEDLLSKDSQNGIGTTVGESLGSIDAYGLPTAIKEEDSSYDPSKPRTPSILPSMHTPS